METGYQSNIRLDQLVFTGNIPAQHSIGDFGMAQGTDNYTLTLQPVLTEYKNGLPLRVVFAASNTGPVTLNVNNLGAVPVRLYAGVSLSAELNASELEAGKVYHMVYLNNTFQLLNPARNSGTNTGSGH